MSVEQSVPFEASLYLLSQATHPPIAGGTMNGPPHRGHCSTS